MSLPQNESVERIPVSVAEFFQSVGGLWSVAVSRSEHDAPWVLANILGLRRLIVGSGATCFRRMPHRIRRFSVNLPVRIVSNSHYGANWDAG